MLSAGIRLGPYEILAPLGAGGMGEVYRSRDTRLDRIVAIKVLPEALAADPQGRERFEREARTISQLTHPHICTLHDVGNVDGIEFLVMEYLEGETLAARLERGGALKVDEAAAIALDIASALDAAHRSGIVHRDLKPGNVMLTKSGAKLLDFGLAKSFSAALPGHAGLGLTGVPTTPANLTAQGAIVGTFFYMAPEQLEGEDADARTDIFAFGCVLYEMVTGRKAFTGKSHASLISAIMSTTPAPIASVQPFAPPGLDRIVQTCLAKDPDDRWQSARDLLRELKWVAEGAPISSSPASAAAVATPRRSATLWSIAAVLFGATTVALTLYLIYVLRSIPPPSAVRFTVSPPEKIELDVPGRIAGLGSNGGSVSPDGRRLALTMRDASGKVTLWIRSLDSLLAQQLPATDGAEMPFWAPDSRNLGFFAEGKLKRIDVTGGPPQTLCDAPSGRGGTWNRDGVIVFAPNITTPLYRVAASGGEPVALTKIQTGQQGHRFPWFLPDGRHFLFRLSRPITGGPSILVGSLDSNETIGLTTTDSGAAYAAGYVLFSRQGTLIAQAFDRDKLRMTGDPFPVADRVATSSLNGVAAFSVSENGVLTYRQGDAIADEQVLTWVDRTGKTVGTVGSPVRIRGIDLSVDGRLVAAHRHESNGGDVWVLDPERGTTTRLTFDAAEHNVSPVWSPDGSRIAFGAQRNGRFGIYLKASNGGANEERVLDSADLVVPTAWSPDGRFIAYTRFDPSSAGDVLLLPLTGDRKPVSFVQTPFNEAFAQISPDGRWLAYGSNEGGNTQIYVRPFPSGTGKWQISTTTGAFGVRWRADGKELYYMTGGSPTDRMMAVSVKTTGAALEPSTPRALFETRYFNQPHGGTSGGGSYHTFAVSPDGQRFLIPLPSRTDDPQAPPAPITVVLNWTAGLKK